MIIDLEEVTKKAKEELAEEKFREAVNLEKQRLLKYRPFWNRVFPWKIIIKRRK